MKESEYGYQRWNNTTATCYLYNMICENCPNDSACAVNPVNNNLYRMRAVKFATLMTFKNIGKKGLERFLDENRD